MCPGIHGESMKSVAACLSFFAVILFAVAVDGQSPEPTDAEILFSLQVKPLLASKCWSCHGQGPDSPEGDLDLRSRQGMLAGGESGEHVLVPGRAKSSLLYTAVTWEDPVYEMPPKENDRLTEEQTWWFRDWINAGAPWPSTDRMEWIQRQAREEAGDQTTVPTSGGLSEEWSNRFYKRADLWAYQPVVDHPVPTASDGEVESAGGLDAFIETRLRDLRLPPAPRADRRTLIRRATYDLTGLPPSPEEVRAFEQDSASDQVAFRGVVERLLDSPHYGEKWGRYWLDVVRYADSSGLANDYERPNAWRYRDYVIRAFNNDKPYDQFVREQIAGDELNPTDPEHLIAAGFLRMGPWEHTGMSVGRVTRQQFLDDVTDSIGQVFLSHPLQCAKCHDHKFDPIPTRDYYRLQAVFATTQFAGRAAPFLSEENLDGLEEARGYLQQRIAYYEQILKHLQRKEEQAARAWYAERGLNYAPRQELLKQGVSEGKIAPRFIGLDVADVGMERIARKNLTRHRWELDRFRPFAFSVYSGVTRPFRTVDSRLSMPADPAKGGTLDQTSILAGGDPFSPTIAVTPGVLSCLSGAKESQKPNDRNSVPNTLSGRRSALARWIADPRNPLTTRSIVNRVWQGHFGIGIAGNANNFGAMGKKPTHPELLDWLVCRFLENGWSIKSLHRLMMNSDVYCRSAEHPESELLEEKDPQRQAYAVFQPRRLTAEEVRDSMLAVSGELNREVGGIPVRPDINLEAALQPRQVMGTYAPAYQPSPRPEQRHRRSIYALQLRGLRDPLMEVFNQPGAEKSCELRDTSTITPQVFALWNSQTVFDRSLALAGRVLRETTGRKAAVDRIFQLAYGRSAQTEELDACLAHWTAMTERHQNIDFPVRSFPVEVVREAVEETSGQTFAFTEELEVYEDYEADPGPADVDEATRGLAEVCLVVFNSNEFMYVP